MNPSKSNQILVIGISGVTCGGKTTLASQLCNTLPNSRLMSQDDYFLDVDDPRHIWIPELNHINFDILTSLDMKKMYQDISTFLSNNQANNTLSKECHVVANEDAHLSNYVSALISRVNLRILIVEGFCIYNYKPLQDAFHLKYYLVLDEKECWERRKTRVYEPPDSPGYFEQCAWPEHLKQKQQVMDEVNDIKYIDGNVKCDDVLATVLSDISSFVHNKYLLN